MQIEDSKFHVLTRCGVISYPPGQFPVPLGTVLLEHHFPERRLLMRCDGHCHGNLTFVDGPCSCLCDGAFHGIGEPHSPAWNLAVLLHGERLLRKWGPLGIDCAGLARELEKRHVKSAS